jgi:hypothetical protein
MQGMLLLGGKHLDQFKGNVKAMTDQVHKGGKEIAGFADQQKTLNGKLADAKGSWSALMITLGNYLLPVAKKVLDWFNASMPAIERWVNAFAAKATPVIKEFGGWLKNDLWPALKHGYDTALPGVKLALDILTGGVGDGTASWKQIGDAITKNVIPALATFAKYDLPIAAAEIRIIIETVKTFGHELGQWITIIDAVAIVIIKRFADMAAGYGAFLLALSLIPGFGWAKVAGKALLDAATAGYQLVHALESIKSPPPINIAVNAYGTSAIANAIISGNAPLANSMLAANHYASGGAYTTSSTGSRPTNGGMRAAGGPVMPGVTYRVGEQGPEDVTFGAPGYVHDARSTKAASKGAALHIENYYEAKTPVGQVASDLMFKMAHA